VKKTAFLAAMAAVVLAGTLMSRPAPAQAPARAPQARPQIYLLDVSAVFKQHRRMQAMMEDMKKDVERAEQAVKAERDKIRQLAERLKEFRSGTPDYRALEEDLTKAQADLSVRVQLQKKEFLQREAKIFYSVYQEVQQELNYLASQTGVMMVLRTTSEQPDVENPQEVLAYLNRDVIWNTPQVDITSHIIKRLNDRYDPRQAGRGGGTTPQGGNQAHRSGHGVQYK
jgi:Skp family chaperone for outer membrane proteins